MNEDLKKLHSAVSSKFNIGDYETFESKMQDTESRKSFYDVVSKKGFSLGEYDAYEGRLSSSLKKKETTTESPVEEDSTVGAANTGTGENPSTTSPESEVQEPTERDQDVAFEAARESLPFAESVGLTVLNSVKKALKTIELQGSVNTAKEGEAIYFTPSGRAVTQPPPPAEVKLEAIESVMRIQKEIESLPKTKGEINMEKEIASIMEDSDSSGVQKFAAVAGTLVTNPGPTALQTIESFVSQAPYLPIAVAAAAMTGGTSVMANAFGMALSATASESQLAIMDGIREQGVDPSNKEELVAFFNNPEAIKEAEQFAGKRGVAIGVVEGVFSIIGGKAVGAFFKNASRVSKNTGRGALSFAIETLGEGSGEAAAQGASGQDFDVSQVAREMFTGTGRSLTSTGINMIGAERTSFIGEGISRDKARKLIEGARTPMELSMISVEESDRAISELYKQKEAELNESGDNGLQENEESSSVDESTEPESSEAISDVRDGDDQTDGGGETGTNGEVQEGNDSAVDGESGVQLDGQVETTEVTEETGEADTSTDQASEATGSETIGDTRNNVIKTAEGEKVNDLSDVAGDIIGEDTKESDQTVKKEKRTLLPDYKNEKRTSPVDVVFKKVFNMKTPAIFKKSGVKEFFQWVLDSDIVYRDATKKLNLKDSQDALAKKEALVNTLPLKIGAITKVISLDDPSSVVRRALDAGISFENLSSFMQAQHAPEANADILDKSNSRLGDIRKEIAEIESKVDSLDELGARDTRRHEELKTKEAKYQGNLDRGHAGFSDKEATAFMESLTEDEKLKLTELAKEFRDKVTSKIIDSRKDSGILTTEEAEDLSKFEFYVPMQVEAYEQAKKDGTSKPKGKAGKGFKEREGSDKTIEERVNPIIHSVELAVQSIKQSENNKVLQAFAEVAAAFPSDELKVFVDNKKLPDAVKENGVIFYDNGVRKVIYSPVAEYQKMLKNEANELGQVAGTVMGFVSGVGGWIRVANTMYNPNFILPNLFADNQASVINALALDNVSGKDIVKNHALMISHFRGLNKGRKGQTGSKVQQLVNDAKEDGVFSSFGALTELDRQKKKLEKAKSDLSGFKEESSKAYEVASKILPTMLSAIQAANEISEMTSRVAIYKTVLDAGGTRQQAAKAAREATTNFARRGDKTFITNALWLFSNTAAQSVRISGKALAKSKKVKVASVSLAFAGFLESALNDVLGGEDEDEDRIQDWEKASGFVMLNPLDPKGTRLKFRGPYFFRMFKYLGNNIYDLGAGKKTPMEFIADQLKALAIAANPIYSETYMQMLMPTLLDPFVMIAENKDYLGNPVKPASYDSKDRVESNFKKSRTPEIYREVAQAANSASGGSKSESGQIDWSPESLRLFAEFLYGGVGRTVAMTFALGSNLMSEEGRESIKASDIPILKSFVSDTPETFEASWVYSAYNESETKLFSEADLAIYAKRLGVAFKKGHLDERQFARLDNFFENQKYLQEAREKGTTVKEIRDSNRKPKRSMY